MRTRDSDFYAKHAKALVKDIREQKDVSYKELARKLEPENAHDGDVDVQMLINRVNKGKFSFAFALELLAALGVKSIDIPVPPQKRPKT